MSLDQMTNKNGRILPLLGRLTVANENSISVDDLYCSLGIELYTCKYVRGWSVHAFVCFWSSLFLLLQSAYYMVAIMGWRCTLRHKPLQGTSCCPFDPYSCPPPNHSQNFIESILWLDIQHIYLLELTMRKIKNPCVLATPTFLTSDP